MSDRGEDCYLEGDADCSVRLVCERYECAVKGYAKGATYPWTEQLPYNCLPEYAVMRRAKHLATHGSVAIPHVDDVEEI